MAAVVGSEGGGAAEGAEGMGAEGKERGGGRPEGVTCGRRGSVVAVRPVQALVNDRKESGSFCHGAPAREGHVTRTRNVSPCWERIETAVEIAS